MSKQERVSWVSSIVSVVVAWLYFSHVLQYPPDAGPASATRVASSASSCSAFRWASITEVAIRIVQSTRGHEVDDSNAKDERDELIGLKSARIGYAALSTGVFIVLAQIAIIEWFAPSGARHGHVPETLGEAILTGPVTPAIVWQLLLAASTFAGIAVSVGRIVYYRRGG